MLRSMTGFGTATADTTGGRFVVEIRSVNHRFSEVQVRLPRELAAIEDRVRTIVLDKVARGRVEVGVTRDNQTRRPRMVRADVELASAYLSAARELAERLGLQGEVPLRMVAEFPDVIRLEESREDVEALWPGLQMALGDAMGAFLRARGEEGQRLQTDFQERLDRIAGLVADIQTRSRSVVQEYAVRLRQRLSELLAEIPVDDARLATELAIAAERSDISEELTRLVSHLAQFEGTMRSEEGPVGRKLEFLLQEMGRETNTIGAKANDVVITRTVIAIKSDLESLREQVQNVE